MPLLESDLLRGGISDGEHRGCDGWGMGHGVKTSCAQSCNCLQIKLVPTTEKLRPADRFVTIGDGRRLHRCTGSCNLPAEKILPAMKKATTGGQICYNQRCRRMQPSNKKLQPACGKASSGNEISYDSQTAMLQSAMVKFCGRR